MAKHNEHDDAFDPGDFNRQLIGEFRANEGKVGGMFAGAPMLLLTTAGAKSGRTHVVPLVYTVDDGRMVVMGSKGGASTHPDWYHNVRANPEVTVEIVVRARVAEAPVGAVDPYVER